VKGKDGSPKVWKLSDCEGERSGIDADTCKELFTAASACRNNPPEGQSVEDCTRGAVSEWVSDNLEAEE
jgi:hypothetical protein